MTPQYLPAAVQLVRELQAARLRARTPADRLRAYRAAADLLGALSSPSAGPAMRRARRVLAALAETHLAPITRRDRIARLQRELAGERDPIAQLALIRRIEIAMRTPPT